MPLVGAAAITGVAALGGAAISHKGNKAALKSSERARKEALEYEKSQAAKAEAAAAQREAIYEREMDQWRQQQDALLKRYGINRTSPRFSVGAKAVPGTAPRGFPGMMGGIPSDAYRLQGQASLKNIGRGPQKPMVNPYDLEGWDA